MRKHFAETVIGIAKADDRCRVLLGDIGVHSFRELFDESPSSILNIGILEQAMIGVAAGMAMDNRIPIVHSIAPFLVERCLEQLKVDFAYQGLSGKFVSVGSSFDYSALGCTHHCPSDVANLLAIPDFQIVVPGTGAEFSQLFSETYENGSNTYYRLSETSHSHDVAVKFGEVSVVRRGRRGVLVAVGPLLSLALEASQDLDVSLVYLTTISPFDYEGLRRATETPRIFVLEPFYEGTLTHLISKSFPDSDHSVRCKGVPRTFLYKYGTRDEHMVNIGFDSRTLHFEIQRFFS
jgi:transketolase